MSKCTNRNIEFLRLLAKSRKTKRDQLLANATKDQIHCLTEIAHNTLKGNINFKNGPIKKLKKFRKEIRKLAKKSVTIDKKRKILSQRGGFLPVLLTPIISALVTSAISKVLANSL